jgi:formamidopyrimidine-DNA glycosylase
VGGHPTADWVSQLPSNHTRVIFTLTKGKLFFNDLRVFGWIKVVGAMDLNTLKERMPHDVVDKSFTSHYLQKILSTSRRFVKSIIMDQAKLGGVGNIYANDALYCAGINPRLTGIALSKNETKVDKLFICLKRVIGQGIRLGGASDSNYVHLNGLGGKYQERFLVYKQQGKKCRRPACRQAGAVIKKIKLGGRGTYFCPKCQK